MMDFCCQIVATRDIDRPKTLILRGLQDFSLYSHSMQPNAIGLISVSPVRSRDSDSTEYLYSPCSTASLYHFFISVIKRLFCCGLRGIIPLESLYAVSVHHARNDSDRLPRAAERSCCLSINCFFTVSGNDQSVLQSPKALIPCTICTPDCRAFSRSSGNWVLLRSSLRSAGVRKASL